MPSTPTVIRQNSVVDGYRCQVTTEEAQQSDGNRNAYQQLLRGIERDLQESAAIRARCGAALRTCLNRLEERRGPEQLQKRKRREEQLLLEVIELLLSEEIVRTEKTPGWSELLGQQ